MRYRDFVMRSSLADPHLIGVSWSVCRICELPSSFHMMATNNEHFPDNPIRHVVYWMDLSRNRTRVRLGS